MMKDSKIYVAGHTGLVGSAICRLLRKKEYTNVITRNHDELPLDDYRKSEAFFSELRPEYVFLAAAKVGGIQSNIDFPATFITSNLQIQTNVIDLAYKYGAKKLLFLGSSCIYPREAQQPIQESSLLSGALEETNKPYAVAKIAGTIMCDAYRAQHGFDAFTVMPSNVYGIGDNFHPDYSHLVAGMMYRMHHAKLHGEEAVKVWGTGKPKRELIFSEDLADACLYLMKEYKEGGMVNVGSGVEIAVSDLALQIKDVVGYQGRIVFDVSKPDGTMRKVMDNTKLFDTGWRPKTQIIEGLKRMYSWYSCK